MRCVFDRISASEPEACNPPRINHFLVFDRWPLVSTRFKLRVYFETKVFDANRRKQTWTFCRPFRASLGDLSIYCTPAVTTQIRPDSNYLKLEPLGYSIISTRCSSNTPDYLTACLCTDPIRSSIYDEIFLLERRVVYTNISITTAATATRISRVRVWYILSLYNVQMLQRRSPHAPTALTTIFRKACCCYISPKVDIIRSRSSWTEAVN